MKEDYASFKTAMLLKEKGFDETCYACYEYFESGVTLFKGWPFEYKGKPVHNTNDRIKCPTLQMAMKWLRETHGIEVIIDVCKVGEDHRTMYAWTPVVVKEDRLEYPVSQTDGTVFGGLFDGYGQAVEKGIEYCLENLIQPSLR